MAERNLSDSKTAIFRYNIKDQGYVLRDCVYGEHSPFSFQIPIQFSSARFTVFFDASLVAYIFVNIKCVYCFFRKIVLQ